MGIVSHVTDIADQEPLPSEDTTPEEQHDPHQFDDAPEIESDPILDYINSQHHQEEDMNNALQAYNGVTYTSEFWNTEVQYLKNISMFLVETCQN